MPDRSEKAQEKRRVTWQKTLLPLLIQKTRNSASSSCEHRLGSKLFVKATRLAADGIPTSIRGDIWKAVVGNRLGITRGLFDVCKARARRMEVDTEAGCFLTLETAGGGEAGGRKIGKFHTFSLIARDMFRTFDELRFLHDDPVWRANLSNILEAWVMYRPDIGYVQGMSYIACMLILNISDNFEQFVCFANIICTPFCLDIFDVGRDNILGHVEAFSLYVDKRLPAIAKHFKSNDVSVHMYLLRWLKTVFCQGVGIEVTVAIWDCFLLEGEVFLCRATLALLKLLEPHLLAAESMSDIMPILHHFPARCEASDVIKMASQFSIDPVEFHSVLRDCINHKESKSKALPRTPRPKKSAQASAIATPPFPRTPAPDFESARDMGTSSPRGSPPPPPGVGPKTNDIDDR